MASGQIDWYSYNYTSNTWWISMTAYGWRGGEHVMDDFGNLVSLGNFIPKW